MIVDASELQFTPDDNARWQIFLASPTGQRLIPKLAESAPRLLAKGDTNEILIRNGELLGFQTAVQAMLELQHVPQAIQPAPEAYPSLDDDTAWPNPTS